MKTLIVNIKKDKYDVLIDRSTIWGNPFIIGKDGNRKQVIEKYRLYLINNPYLMSRIHELKGLQLGCHCKTKECHGDVIVDILEGDYHL